MALIRVFGWQRGTKNSVYLPEVAALTVGMNRFH